VLLAEFGAWLTGERGLSPATVRGYRKHARVFLAGLPEPLDGALQRLDAGQVTSFMLGYCQGRSTEAAMAMVTAIRALLRFVHVSGRTPILLAGAVPAVAGWRLASLPRGLAAGQVGRLLDGCGRDTVTGRRDYAILTVLARLGLRGAEAAALQLGDIDWRAGEVMICGKGARVERLPLPVPVGETLAAWLTGGRARCGSPAVFVTVRAPCRQLSPEAVRAIMGRACDRAGLARRGAHRLRHSLATEMLRAGASLPEVGQVLRHRSQLATSVYAKVDENALRQAAQEYLAMRRALGFKLTTHGHQLMSFVEFCEARGTDRITTEFALAWAMQTSRGSSDEVYWSRRLMVVRIFARHLAALDPATEVPPEDMLPHHYRRIAPYLYSPARSPR
jgi:integrase/recombinase XerD